MQEGTITGTVEIGEATTAKETGVAGNAAAAEVKGWRNGLLLLLPTEGAWPDVIEQVHVRLDEAKARSFWRGAQTTIDCRTRLVSLEELTALLDRIKGGFGLVPIALVSPDAGTRAAAEKLALTAYAEMPVVRKPAPRDGEGAASAASPTAAPAPTAAVSDNAAVAAPNALYLTQTVRSGQRIVHEGHLIIYGDVNAGAEVVAGGDILIFGTLRGLAHAGYNGDEAARIVAASLHPPQLRIAGKIARSPEAPARTRPGIGGAKNAPPAALGGPEVARIVDGEIQVFPL